MDIESEEGGSSTNRFEIATRLNGERPIGSDGGATWREREREK